MKPCYKSVPNTDKEVSGVQRIKRIILFPGHQRPRLALSMMGYDDIWSEPSAAYYRLHQANASMGNERRFGKGSADKAPSCVSDDGSV